MRLRIIGSAAGGGFPQWNGNDRQNRAVRAGVPFMQARTQSSLIASANGADWVVFNASPDIRQQIAATPELKPADDGTVRSSPIRAVILTSADVDHVAGLLSLRERQPFAIYASAPVLEALAANPIFSVLDEAIVPRRLLPDRPFEVAGADGHGTGVRLEAFAVPGKVALFREDRARPDADYGSADGDTIGLRILSGDGGRLLAYLPACARLDAALKARLAGVSIVLFDGTLYTDDEMVVAGTGTKTGQRMGHMSMAGPEGAIAALADVAIGRRIFVHINNSNPVLDERSAEHAAVRAAGWEIAHDGMELVL